MLEIVFEHFCNYTKIQLKMGQENHLSESELLDFHFTLKRLKNNEPIQYIIGKAPFYGLEFSVDSNVLIPRPETEELVEWILESIDADSKILDIGTGSGCIPLSIKNHMPNSDISACDIDPNAIEVANKNANQLQLEVDFFQTDILDESNWNSIIEKQFKVVISNPPYIELNEATEMEENVLQFEPHLALFVDDNPLLFYDKIGRLAYEMIGKTGHLFFEINQKLGTEVKELMLNIGYGQVQIKHDINGNSRMIHAKI